MTSEKTLLVDVPGVPYQPRRSRRRLSWILNLLLLYLAGVTIVGKGPTYLAIGPIFWGEIVLLLSLIWAFRRWGRMLRRARSAGALTFMICSFVFLGAIEGIRDYPAWGLDALRDSAIWYYAFFYFVGLVIASDVEESAVFGAQWKLFWIVSVVWGSANILSGYRLEAIGANLPGGFLLSSSGLESVQSIGLGCILLLTERGRGWLRGPVPRIMLVVSGLVTVGTYYGRGGKLSVLSGFLVVIAPGVLGRAFDAGARKKIFLTLVLLILGAIGAVAWGVDLLRALSLDRFEATSEIDDTAGWRADWWANLYDHVMAVNPVFGIGFGENLADYNQYLQHQSTDRPTRSPHNFNVTVFSRMGIVGTVIWGSILFFGVIVPFRRVFSESLDQAEVKERTFWIAVAVAIWVNASFGVLMEGPVSGIPFWLVLGLIAGKRQRTRPRWVNQGIVTRALDRLPADATR